MGIENSGTLRSGVANRGVARGGGSSDPLSQYEVFFSVRLTPYGNYSGDCMRVRRGDNNAEADIPFLGCCIDTAALDLHCSGTDGFVAKWYNQDGSGNDAIQTVASSQPKIYDATTGVLLQNCKPALSFDGVDDYLPFDNSGIVNTNFSIFSTLKRNTAGEQNFFLGGETSGNNRNLIVGWRNANTATCAFFADDLDVTTPTELNQTLFTCLFNDTTLARSIHLDGTLTGNDISSGMLIANAGSSIGKFSFSEYSNMQMQELIIYTSDESSNRVAIETNINAYFRSNKGYADLINEGSFAVDDITMANARTGNRISMAQNAASNANTVDSYSTGGLTFVNTIYGATNVTASNLLDAGSWSHDRAPSSGGSGEFTYNKSTFQQFYTSNQDISELPSSNNYIFIFEAKKNTANTLADNNQNTVALLNSGNQRTNGQLRLADLTTDWVRYFVTSGGQSANELEIKTDTDIEYNFSMRNLRIVEFDQSAAFPYDGTDGVSFATDSVTGSRTFATQGTLWLYYRSYAGYDAATGKLFSNGTIELKSPANVTIADSGGSTASGIDVTDGNLHSIFIDWDASEIGLQVDLGTRVTLSRTDAFVSAFKLGENTDAMSVAGFFDRQITACEKHNLYSGALAAVPTLPIT